MSEQDQKDLIFALDIGTRTIIGLVMKYNDPSYEIVACEVIEHETRAMLDGQIHNVNEVAKQVQKIKTRLEEKLDIKLEKVAIAAAGRALKTIVKQYSMEFEHTKDILAEDVEALEFAAVQEAQEELAALNEARGPGDYHFVGYSVIEYHLDGILLSNLIGQRGGSIQVEIVVTFLPRIVIDSLLSVINQVELEVKHLTLEPIAAANIVIPAEMYNFNLALVDIGAGTSDIALTKGGSMVGYAMVPVAGDEITEALAEEYLLDYNSAEKVKRLLTVEDVIESRNILGKKVKIESKKAIKAILPEIKKLASLITDKIQEINMQSPQAVICIGGGALTPFLTREMATQLNLDEERIGVKDGKGIKHIDGKIKNINDTQTLTPIGIAVDCHQSQKQAIFLRVEVNERPVQLFVLNQPTVSDALLAAEINIKEMKASPGMGLTFTVNGEFKMVKGSHGEPGYVLLNGNKADLDTPIETGDKIEFISGQDGEDAVAVIADVLPKDIIRTYEIMVDGNRIELISCIYQNQKQVELDTPVQDGAEITYNKLETIRDGVARLLEVDPERLGGKIINFTFNREEKEITTGDYMIKEGDDPVDLSRPLEDGLELRIFETKDNKVTIEELQEERQKEIIITFNGSQLTVPLKPPEIKCNDKKVDSNYEIQPGDNIICKTRYPDVNQVLNYINYQLSPAMKTEIDLLINNQQAQFEDKVYDDDEIMIKFNSGQLKL